MIAHYKAVARPNGNFDAVYAILGAQRNAKIIGIFTRRWKRDGKLRYLSFLPRMWNLLDVDLAPPAFVPVAAWFAATLQAAYNGTASRGEGRCRTCMDSGGGI